MKFDVDSEPRSNGPEWPWCLAIEGRLFAAKLPPDVIGHPYTWVGITAMMDAPITNHRLFDMIVGGVRQKVEAVASGEEPWYYPDDMMGAEGRMALAFSLWARESGYDLNRYTIHYKEGVFDV